MTKNTHIKSVRVAFSSLYNSEYNAHHWLSNITIYFIIPAYQISNYTKPYQRTHILILLWNLSPSMLLERPPERLTSLSRTDAALHCACAAHSRAPLSWRWRAEATGVNQEEKRSAAGSTDNERVCWTGRRWPRGPQTFVDFSRGWWRTYPPSSLWVFAASRRATCQVSGLSSNFHGCAEITKSLDPSFPFDRPEEKPGYLQVLAFSVLVSSNYCPGGF